MMNQFDGTSARKIFVPTSGELAPLYLDLGGSVLPVHHQSKKPDYRYGALRDSAKLHMIQSRKGRELLRQFYSFHGGGGLALVCGSTSENWFVIDCDNRSSADYIREELKNRDIPRVEVYTARGSHFHMKAREGAVKTIAAGLMVDIEIRGQGAIAVLPPTRHKSGVIYQFANGIPDEIPTVSITDIDFLQDASGAMVELKTVGGERRLHNNTHNYIRYGHKYPEGKRNTALYNAARDYRYVGLPVVAAIHDLVPIAVASGLSKGDAEATVYSPYENIQSANSEHAVVTIQQKLVLYTNSLDYPGRKGSTDRAMIQALLDRRRVDAHNSSTGIFRASYRELMELSRVSSMTTITKCLKRLIKQKVIESAGKNNRKASLWRFTDSFLQDATIFYDNCNSSSYGTKNAVYCYSSRKNWQNVLSERKSLGKRGYQVYEALLAYPDGIRAKALAAVVGIGTSGIYYQLRKLIKFGLAKSDSGHYFSIADVTQAHNVAIETKAFQKQQQREQRNAEERAIWMLSPIIEYFWKRAQKKRVEARQDVQQQRILSIPVQPENTPQTTEQSVQGKASPQPANMQHENSTKTVPNNPPPLTEDYLMMVWDTAIELGGKARYEVIETHTEQDTTS